MTSSDRSEIGWIGLGNMGSRMALRLLGAGHALVAFDRNEDRVTSLAAGGALRARSVAEVGERCAVVFCSLPHGEALAEVATGPDGLASRLRPGACLIDTSTVSAPASAHVAAGLAERGIAFLRAPVSGSIGPAAEGRLSFFVSGPPHALAEHRALLDRLGTKLVYLGSGEEARVMKLVVNLVVAITNGGLAEALDFGRRSGLDWSAMLDGIADSVAASPYVLSKVDTLKRRDWTAAGPVWVIAKDLDYVLEAGRTCGSYMPLAALARQSLAALQGRGAGNLDLTAVLTLLEEPSPSAVCHGGTAP